MVVSGARSEFVSVQSGVPQGSVLGPYLFLIYIKDLPDTLTTQTRLFADDTAAYKVVTCPDEQTQLQRDLNQLAEWEKRWDMAFRPGKCTSLPVICSRKPMEHQYELRGHMLETVSSAKYLGVTISRGMNWSEHINNVCTKANKTLGQHRHICVKGLQTAVFQNKQ